MREYRFFKTLALIAFVLGIAGITLSYASYTNTLSITPSSKVSPDSSLFKVELSSNESYMETNSITPTLNKIKEGFYAENALIDNSNDPTLSNLKTTFTEPGESVTYSFYAYNSGKYIAYLNSIVFSGEKRCIPKTGSNEQLVQNACNGIEISIKVGDDSKKISSVASISNHILGISQSENIQVTISYKDNSSLADGDFDVELPSIVLTYNSVD